MRKLLLLSAVSVSMITLLVIHSCKKESTDGIVQPITITKPDSLITYKYAGSSQTINIQFVTDRPLDYAKCMYQIDSSQNPNFVYTYPDTLFYKILDTIPSQLSNKYTYTGFFQVPDSLKALDVIRFDVKMKASGNPSNPDTLRYEKQFKISIL